ncbi:threonine aldolase family protein [Chondromyces apiculatus]|uniref:Low-specificity L-threonine aldolase n=1 Tax=Chondromyces apiculatus DSM 436 TaxID=1192034 RepID=A0A017T9R5_9BACT|nr:beta-eliminating lyase-related protein [Chondromyces apiculatus]EYF05672.1 Low-specificity L-threonine aldolase [Chondromyces apiculatus DSM 436]
MTELDLAAIRARCTRALSHEAPAERRAAARLAALAALAPADFEQDFYGEGELLAGFERRIADLLGKEAAVFMPSGTMAQQIALRIWCDRRHHPVVAFHPKCHLEIHEERGYARLHQLSAVLVGPPDGLLTPAHVEKLREPITALLLELPQREIGGVLPPWEDLLAIRAWASAHGVALHLDGARLWESAPFYGRTYAEIAALFDSVYVSTYKGLGGIAGCLLAGPADFIAESRVWQRRHGGNLFALYPYFLSAMAGLDAHLGKMSAYRDKAVAIAARLALLPGVEVIPDPPHTNMMHLALRGTPEGLERAALEIADETKVWLFGKVMRTGVPSVQRVEVTVGEGGLAMDTEEIGQIFTSLLERAHGGREMP